ncbi:MAG: hypothetical protein JW947_09985 [Sedimentisphaerales bacterium]|nr:hypothetical protein [Sedimentisphaerales bacterium]
MTRKLIAQSIVVIVLIIVAVFILFFDMPMPKGSMTLEEINSARRELIQITDSNDEESERISKLENLAKRVGAGTINTKIAGSTTYPTNTGGTVIEKHLNSISESELVQNINQALQTHMLFDSCRTANKQYKIAVLAAITAVFSTFITWNISKRKT